MLVYSSFLVGQRALAVDHVVIYDGLAGIANRHDTPLGNCVPLTTHLEGCERLKQPVLKREQGGSRDPQDWWAFLP